MATWPAKTNYATGDVLTAAEMQDIGNALNSVESAQYAAGKNKIMNADFRINQRAITSTTTSDTFVFDRFILVRGAGGTVTLSSEAFTPGTAPVAGYEGINFARLVSVGQSAASDRAVLQQRIEDARTFAGQTVTLSFWAKASTGTPNIAFDLGQNFGSGGSPSATVTGIGAQKFAITSSWVRYSKTFSIPSVAGKTFGTNPNSSLLGLNIFTSAGSDFNSRTDSLGNQNVTIDIWGIQLEAGNTATAFQTATGTLAGELAACQRYFYRKYSDVTAGGFGNVQATSTTNVDCAIPHPVTMRTTPTIARSGLTVTNATGTRQAVSALVAGAPTTSTADFALTTGGLVAGNAATIRGNGTSTTDYLEASAEL